MKKISESNEQTRKGLYQIIPNLILDSDYDEINLDSTTELMNQLCRAWLIQFLPRHPQHQQAKKLLIQNKNSNCIEFLETIRFHKNINEVSNSNSCNMWNYFCPTAQMAHEDAENLATSILKRRRLKNLKKSEVQLKEPAKELLLSSNVLISPPIDINSKNIPSQFLEEAVNFTKKEQDYWYDHPIPMDASIGENELVYGLKKLDKAIDFEKKCDVIAPNSKMAMVLSISVTHTGMEELAERYVADLINENLKLKNLDLYLFNENLCKQIISMVSPKKETVYGIFGVNGSYGRHFSFLKAILALWNKTINSKTKFTFKIDLDQVFDQKFLLNLHGKTALQLLCNPYWGGSATDYKGKSVDLGMIAGGLINQSDSSIGIFVPDVKRPKTKEITSNVSSKRIFCSQWPQAISTETEIGYSGNDLQRVHVTGGTTGINLNSLIKWKPFTPSFISRAEDQAFVLSAFHQSAYLSQLHAPGLIMRHDKASFAGRSIANAADSKAIGDIERILLFSNYSDILHVNKSEIVEHMWPFTSSFISDNPEILAGLIFALDGANKSTDYVEKGSKRLLLTIEFCRTKMKKQLDHEIEGWNIYYDSLISLSQNSLRYLNKMIHDSSIKSA